MTASERHVYIHSPMSKTHIAVLRDGSVILPSDDCDYKDVDVHATEIVMSISDLDTSDFCRRCLPEYGDAKPRKGAHV